MHALGGRARGLQLKRVVSGITAQHFDSEVSAVDWSARSSGKRIDELPGRQLEWAVVAAAIGERSRGVG